MAIEKILTYEGLAKYNELVMNKITTGDETTLSSAKSYADELASGKANSSHNHDDKYYTETEIDSKLSTVNSTISTHTSNSDIHVTTTNKSNWNSAYTHSTSAHAPSNAEKNIIVGIQKNGTDLTVDSSTRKVNITVPTTAAEIGAATSGHNHDSAYDKKGASDSALASAKTYADNAVAKVKNDLLNGAGTAYDTLKELGDLIDDNADAIDALETIASGKADKTHSHDIATTSASGFMSADMVTKLNGIATGANKTVVDTALSSSSTNPVQNKVVNSAISTLTSTVNTNTNSISAHTSAISALEEKIGDGFEIITNDDIAALFK